jgi:hypothetical protein
MEKTIKKPNSIQTAIAFPGRIPFAEIDRRDSSCRIREGNVRSISSLSLHIDAILELSAFNRQESILFTFEDPS